MRIAMLEDDPDQAATVSAWLREAQHDVHVFDRPRELMKMSGRESYDLYLIDWNLPEMSGAEVLDWLRGDRGDETPVIFVTARDAEEDIVAALGSAPTITSSNRCGVSKCCRGSMRYCAGCDPRIRSGKSCFRPIASISPRNSAMSATPSPN